MSCYSQLLPCRHLAITNTMIIRTAAESQAKITDILTETNSLYYGLTDTSLGPDTDINQHLSTFWQNYLGL